MRVAEQIALLDVMSGGRCLFGFGRGAASVEYAGFRIPMEEARPRFVEAAKIVVKALTHEVVRVGGRVLQDPAHLDPPAADLASRAALLRLVGEPGVRRDHGQARLRHARHHAERVAEGGRRTSSATASSRGAWATRRGRRSSSPTSRARRAARRRSERAVTYLAPQVGLDRHALPLLGRPPRDREGLRVLRQDGEDVLEDEGPGLPQEGDRLLREDPGVGTPDDCIQQIAELRRLTGLDHLVTEFGFGGMPHEEAELNMRLFADRVMPVLQRDAAFTRVETPADAGEVSSGPGIFAPPQFLLEGERLT